MNFFFNVQNRKYTQALLHCTVHKIFFPTSLYLPKSDSGQESYVRFTSVIKSVLKFQNAQRSMFSHKSSQRSSNSLVLDVLEWKLDGASEYLIFSFVHLWTSSQIDEYSNINCGIWRGWWCILQLF
jgi:hypothetical protein